MTTQTLTIELLLEENRLLKAQIKLLQEQVAWFTKQLFGQRSEKLTSLDNSEQLVLPGLEASIPPLDDDSKKIVPEHVRRSANRNGQDQITFPESIHVETIVLDIAEEDKICKDTGLPLVKIGEEISQKLAYKPGKTYIKKFVRPKYAHPQQEEKGVVIAPMIEGLIPKCRADESFLAHVLVSKFADHLPLYRIAEILSRDGVGVSRKLLSQWVLRCGAALKPLYDLMLEKILKSGNSYVDETPVKLQAKGGCKQAYMWVIVGGNETTPAYRVFRFCETRAHEHALKLLADYEGVFHSDKYQAYEKVAKQKGVIWCPCWVHVRRKFFEAEQGDPVFRKWVLRKIRYLFMLEKVAWARSPEKRLKIRQEKEVPIINELIDKIKARVIDGAILPKSKFKEALGYFCGLIPYLKNYTQHAFARLDNNTAERAIRPLAIGRKNWLFFGSKDGAEAGAVILSLVQTCRGLNINPEEYLEDVMRRIMDHPANQLEELLPDQWLKT